MLCRQQVEMVPAVEAGIVTVGEDQFHRIVAHRLDGYNGYIALASLQHFLADPVTAHLRRGRIDAQQLMTEVGAHTVVKMDFQQTRLLVQTQFGRDWSITVQARHIALQQVTHCFKAMTCHKSFMNRQYTAVNSSQSEQIMAANILLVEDEPAIQELIAANLTRAGHTVVRAADAEAAQRIVRDALPDLVLLDWMLPGMSGIELARRLRAEERTRQIPIIMLTARSEEEDRVLGLETGADDYISKPFSPRELVARIKAVLRRRAPEATEDTVETSGLRLDPSTHRVTAGELGINLGPTEFRLLHYLMTHPERVHSRSQLLDQVWGDHVFVEERTVDVHIRRLRSALEASRHDRLIQTVRGSGYRLSADVPAVDNV
ncbi:MAG: phoB [Rhodocyclales bacterium]|nr:phoB [Rhodocyclales bacterium]